MSALETVTLGVDCSCGSATKGLELKSQIVHCADCGRGKRVRVTDGERTRLVTIDPIEPHTDHQAKSCGALKQ